MLIQQIKRPANRKTIRSKLRAIHTTEIRFVYYIILPNIKSNNWVFMWNNFDFDRIVFLFRWSFCRLNKHPRQDTSPCAGSRCLDTLYINATTRDYKNHSTEKRIDTRRSSCVPQNNLYWNEIICVLPEHAMTAGLRIRVQLTRVRARTSRHTGSGSDRQDCNACQ